MKLSIIPMPQKISPENGVCDIAGFAKYEALLKTPISDNRLNYHAGRLFGNIKKSICPTFNLSVGNGFPENPILTPLEDKTDAYLLEINEKSLRLSAITAQGLFYGIVTLERLFAQYDNIIPCLTITDFADMDLRCDYWDLRSIHPSLENLLNHIPTLAHAKLNGLVIEYEDKLPITNPFNIENVYWSFSEDEFALLKQTCALWFVEIIPLQQSFGHLEYVLKDTRYTHLCETPLAAGDLCPLKPEAEELSHLLIRYMSNRHPDSKYLHIGCDEVWSLCSCDDCKATGKTHAALFIEFANKIIQEVASLGKKPLLWHDMFEQATAEELAKLDKRAIPCIWMYNGNDLPARAADMVAKLNKVGLSYFACPAVRAWDCDDKQNYPVMNERINNIRLWHGVIRKHGIKGIINTNWAACFALAKPYGVYETSFFPLFYSAELSWNTNVDEQSFLQRYFEDFHGYREADKLMERGYRNEDYFTLLGKLVNQLPQNNDIAVLVAALQKFELCTRKHFPLSVVLYRQEFFNSPEEASSLNGKYLVVKEMLENDVPQLQQELAKYLPPHAVSQYMRSRLLVEELVLQKTEEFLTENREECAL